MVFNAIPAEILLKDWQPSLPLYTPRYLIWEEFLTSVIDEIVCEQSETGVPWSSLKSIDHPSFTRLRKDLASKGYIEMETGWANADRVLKKFYLNDVAFNKGDRFICATAMLFHLERSKKQELMKNPETLEYDAELRNYTIGPAYAGGLIARGEVFNDSKGRSKDGDYIRTSIIESQMDGIIVTNNTRYKLV